MSHYSSLESLSLPRRQRVFDNPQLVPAGDALPIWKKLSLDTKLPVVPSPRGCYTLYTTNVGVPKYIHKQHYDFDLNDARYARPAEYDSLHDPFLKEYFHNPRARRQLVHNDLITKDGKVKCNIKEFNEYRSYLRYRSVTELSLQRSRDREEDSWLTAYCRPIKSEPPPRRESRASSDLSDPALQLTGPDVSLVQRMRIRERTLLRRMTEKQRQREKEHDKRVKDSWQGRKQRQQRLIKQEEEIDRKSREERVKLIEQREKELTKQRERMMAKLTRNNQHNNTRHHAKGAKRKEGEEEEDDCEGQEEEERRDEDEKQFASDKA